ncbi:MAG TPA: DEAD/DEAH box helicase, partial [Planctomycetota bacterium]|nr:DEAD/DEAH box helicase [Planctomycetota bacterium]
MDARRFAFVAITPTGPDEAVDRVFRLAARVPDGAGRAEEVVELASPFADLATSAHDAVSTRVHRIYAVSGADLSGRPRAEELFSAFRAKIGDRTVVGFERAELARWWRRLARAGPGPEPVFLGVADLARLVLPGRRSAERERLLEIAFAPASAPRGDPTPAEIETLLGAVARAFLSRADSEIELAASALLHVLEGLRSTDPEAAAVLEASLDLLDRPSAWRSGGAELFPAASELVDGTLSGRARGAEHAAYALDASTPRLTALLEDRFSTEPTEEVAPECKLTDSDRRALDLIFEDLLPREMAERAGERDPRRFHRPAQLELARRIVEALEGREALLVDAPTGTGKTLAYLIPALLWSMRANARVGISTYTIALQEQIFDREVPRALAWLRKAGVDGAPRVSVLKGRERYLCGRALRASAPDPLDPPHSWLAWTIVALFALDDP